MAATISKWKRGGVVGRFDARILDVKLVDCSSESGKRGVFASLGAKDWAIAVALTEWKGAAHCVMVRQYRHGADRIYLEFPGGVVEEGEEPAAAVGRELEEETGFKAGRIVHAGTVSPNPAFLENRFHVFVATDLEFHGRTAFDEHEEIESLLVPLDEVRERMGFGELANAMMVTGLFLAEKVMAEALGGGRPGGKAGRR